MTRQQFSAGDRVEVLRRAGGGCHKWFPASVDSEEHFAGGYEVRVLVDGWGAEWVRNDRRLIRPLEDVATNG